MNPLRLRSALLPALTATTLMFTTGCGEGSLASMMVDAALNGGDDQTEDSWADEYPEDWGDDSAGNDGWLDDPWSPGAGGASNGDGNTVSGYWDSEFDDGVTVESATMDGRLDRVMVANQDARAWAYGNDWGTSIRSTVTNVPGGAAMTILELPEDIRTIESGTYSGYLMGCSGPYEGEWLWDVSADEVVLDVTVEEDGDTRVVTVDYDAGFTGWDGTDSDSEVEGRVVISAD